LRFDIRPIANIVMTRTAAIGRTAAEVRIEVKHSFRDLDAHGCVSGTIASIRLTTQCVANRNFQDLASAADKAGKTRVASTICGRIPGSEIPDLIQINFAKGSSALMGSASDLAVLTADVPSRAKTGVAQRLTKHVL
jgi:hypothetical protein